MFFVFLTLQSAAVPVDQKMYDARKDYATCVSMEAVKLGMNNLEPADTILRAVRSICEPQWGALLVAVPGMGLGPSGDEFHRRITETWKQEAEDAAIVALLSVRARRP